MIRLIAIALLASAAAIPAASLPIDPLWRSAEFRKALTGSYGVDSRIEPKVTSAEKAVLDAVAAKMAAGDRDGAASTLAGSTLLRSSAVMLFNLGTLRFEQGRQEDAVENLKKAIALYPNFRDAHRNLAVALVKESEFEAAEPHLRRATELGAQDGLTLGLLGYCHSAAGRHQAALQAYRTALLTMPDEIQWRLGEAGALLELDELAAAADIFQQLIDLAPERAEIWLNLADVRLRQGQPELAIADLEVARRLDALGAADRIALGHLYLNESLAERAMEHYRAALAMEPPAPVGKAVDAIENLARFERWAEARALAAEVSTQTVGDIDEEAEARLARAIAFCELKAGDAASGAEQVSALLTSNPLDGEALLHLADHLLATGETEPAIMRLEQAAAAPGFEARARRRLGETLAARGDYAGALPELRKALELDPSDAPLRDYIESVESLAGLFERR